MPRVGGALHAYGFRMDISSGASLEWCNLDKELCADSIESSMPAPRLFFEILSPRGLESCQKQADLARFLHRLAIAPLLPLHEQSTAF